MNCINIKFLVLRSVWQNVVNSACQHPLYGIIRAAFFLSSELEVMLKDGGDDGCDILSLFLIFPYFAVSYCQ